MTAFSTADRDSWVRAGRPMPAAVLWDMDGTLVNTEPYWFAAESKLVADHGGQWGLEQAKQLVGFDLLDAGRFLQKNAGVDLAPEAIVEFLVEQVIQQIRVHVEWRPGAARTLAELNARDIPCALVTMSYRNLAQAVVDRLPSGSFTTVVTGDEVAHGKPHPEPYLTAATQLGVSPRDCLTIEDSPTGVSSAEAAGVPVLAVEHLVPIPAGPHRIVVTDLTGTTVDDLALMAYTLRER
jgi:HAD superfamily hydrolase (TIGR01509 family)